MPSENAQQRQLAAIMFMEMLGDSALSQRNETLVLSSVPEMAGPTVI